MLLGASDRIRLPACVSIVFFVLLDEIVVSYIVADVGVAPPIVRLMLLTGVAPEFSRTITV